MKRIIFCLLVIGTGLIAKAQTYNNEWIDHNKTYYKFKVGKTGLYRINQPALQAAGIAIDNAQFFQLWRNGVQVPIYTSVSSGSLTAADYIEFWGEMNDGKPDKALYRDPAYQLNDKWSLISDTASYFLTVNPTSTNLRLVQTSNNVAGNTLSPEPYFMHTIGKYFKDRINSGFAVIVDNQYLLSSSYDKGEGWSSNEIGTGGVHGNNFTDLQTYTTGPAARFNIAVSGNSINTRNYLVRINTDSILGGSVDYFNDAKGSASFPASLLSSNVANIQITNSVDRIVIHKYEITYPRMFNFGGATNFEFSLPASNSGNYLEIGGFSYGAVSPVLYDLTDGKRYIADLSAAPLLKFALSPSSNERKFVLVNEEAANITSVTGFSVRNFIDYKVAGNQGDYLIISNKLLTNGANGSNPVEDYKAYRASAAGGGYRSNAYFMDELIDQFGYGINLNPLGIRNFIRYARNSFSVAPNHVFLIGKGVEYPTQRYYDNADVRRLNLVPVFGFPGSDVLMSAEGSSSIPLTPIGRLSVVHPNEITDYLAKIKQHEQAQATLSPNFEDRGWMKNVAHLVGATEPLLKTVLERNMNNFKTIIADTLYGANVSSFSNSSSNTVGQLTNSDFKKLIENGISFITYFGHSSTGTLQYNIDEPQNYNNTGKYPLFIALGCNAGSFFGADNIRLSKRDGLSEKYVLAPQKGMIGFIASTHFGIVHYLNIWNERFYESLGNSDYGKTIGEAMKSAAIKTFNYTSQEDFYARANVEELGFHGDPAVRVNPHAKTDYLVTDPLVKIAPTFISVADRSFKVDAQFYNIGKAVRNPISIEVKRQFPDNSTKVIYKDTIPGIRYTHAISIDVPIDPNVDKGTNKIIVTVDADNNVDEFYEANNSITKEFLIYEDEARPIYPYEFGIVNQSNTKLIFSTANPFSESKQYQLEIDTTELFNSSFKISKTVTSKGGAVEVNPGFTFTNNTVYYWRVSIVPTTGEFKWNISSFVYLQDHEPGFNQSHAFQHFKSGAQRIYLDSTSNIWKYTPTTPTNILAKTGTFFRSTESQQSVSINGDASFIRSACWYSSIIFNVFEANTNKPLVNTTIRNGSSWPNVGEGLYGSSANSCGFRARLSFEYQYGDTSNRRKMADFLRDVVPDGAYVLVKSFAIEDWWGRPISYAADWANDTAYYGAGRTLYQSLKQAGFAELDSFNRLRQFQFVYKKNDPSFTPKWTFTQGIFDLETLSFDMVRTDTTGTITSPAFGPAKKWKQLLWNGTSLENPTGDNPTINVIGIRKDNSQSILFSNINLSQKSVDISSIDSKQFETIKLQMHNVDTTKHSPYQLGYWRLTNEPAPEGAVAPNIYFKMSDTLEMGQPIEFKMAFKNVSPFTFDSLKIKMVITDRNNVQHILPVMKHRPLNGNDTLHVSYGFDTRSFTGYNSLFVEVNPEDDQPEQYHFNNFIFSKFFVRGDSINPLMDVTFDNVHILNNDIVSSNPDIVIRLKDESRYLLLNDTSLVNVKVRFPSGKLKVYNFNNDTLRFTSAQAGSNNAATINFAPSFTEDGNYELIVSGKDESDNVAGGMEYKVGFQVINKPMISNLLNYPNPFTTSTAFVFTLTGSEVPQNIKIQILTVTGKIVREVTKDELGPLRIGRNITEFKWNGTDQFGQKLGNGIYLYRVVTNLNGKSLDKYKSEKDDTDKYFNKGYGKMYLMR